MKVKKVPLDAFIAKLTTLSKDSGWMIHRGKIGRRDDPDECPWLFVRDAGRMGINNQAIWNAADNVPGHDKTLRKRLLVACGLGRTKA